MALSSDDVNGRSPGWKPNSCGWESLLPFIVAKKLKKHPNKYKPPYKYTMQQYILEKHIKNKSSIYIYIFMPSKLKYFVHNFLTIINSHQKIMLLTKI